MTINNAINSGQDLSITGTPAFSGLSLLGLYTNSAQPAFYAYQDSVTSNVTGDGTVYTVGFNNSLVDQAGNYDNVNTFTAAAAGIYHFEVCLYLLQLGAGHTTGTASLIITSGGNNQVLPLFDLNPGAMRNAANNLAITSSVTTQLSSNDTVIVQLTISGSTKTVDINGSAFTVGSQSSFSGFQFG